jgi:ABC-type transport system substrate-binding protein
MKPKKIKYFFFIVLAVASALFFMNRFQQDKPKNEIRILIDRVPNTLDFSQSPDILAQRLLPLLKDEHYQVETGAKPEDFCLLPPDASLPKLHFEFVRDELSRSMLFQGDHGDVLFDSLSISKTNWLKKHGANIIEGPGFTLSFFGFQLNDPILKNLNVRHAIELALPIREWAHDKLFDYVNVLPEVPEVDLRRANELLDEAGFKKTGSGPRFILHYQTTPVREGNEMAQLFREALKGLSIRVEIQPVETSLFFHRLTGGDFQVFSSRIYRNTAADPVSDFLSTSGVRNYFHYKAFSKSSFSWDDVKTQVFQDLPIIPIFTWKHSAVLSSRITYLPGTETKLDDSFRFLSLLRLK